MNLQLTGFLFYLLNLPKYHESTADRISVSFTNAPTKFSKIKKVEIFFLSKVLKSIQINTYIFLD